MLHLSHEQVVNYRKAQLDAYFNTICQSIDRKITQQIILSGEQTIVQSPARIPSAFKSEIIELVSKHCQELGYFVMITWHQEIIISINEDEIKRIKAYELGLYGEEEEEEEEEIIEEEEEEEEIVDICATCGCAIFKDDAYVADDKGNYFCDDECKNEYEEEGK